MADQEASGENKPQPKQEGQVINLIVKDQQGSEVHFKVKSHTKLEKVRTVLYSSAQQRRC
jgi:small ubiquitin-related modifier